MNEADKEARLREQQARGQEIEQAANLLNKLVLDHLRERCRDTFEASDIHDEAGHRSCRYYLKVLQDIRERIAVLVRTGEDARKELVRLKEPSKLRKAIGL